MASIGLLVDGRPRTLLLKLEAQGAHGSVKGRTAQALWADVADRVTPEVGLIESTSGNLGVALAAVAASHHVPFTAVMDVRSSAVLVDAVRAHGADVVMIDEPDGAGGYLLSQLSYVERRLLAEPRLVWPDQYRNPASPRVHRETTAPELWRQTSRRAMSVVVAVSTGGTLAGFRDFVRSVRPDWELAAVDVVGSAALGGAGSERILPGIGAGRPSRFLPHGHRPALRVSASDAVHACLWLREATGLGVGASSGAAIAAAMRLFRAVPARETVACLCPDGANRYQGTVYDPRWRGQQGLTGPGPCEGAEVLEVSCPPAGVEVRNR
ncbi:pyridoxal-phosphate dependent enzyme [Streptomyces alboniger]|uniref:pyridoxal-phosphate dependent enzyme n=1 Tax=Streptomyces alboniger TaxID=132473 RepID=UPI00142ECD6C|nr:pyridoxal-phosphate dependent enzyme [Streptomyces alboniger]